MGHLGGWRSRVAALTSAALIGATAVMVAGGGIAHADPPDPVVFDDAGAATWTVPANICTITVSLEGASGGSGTDASSDTDLTDIYSDGTDDPSTHPGGHGAVVTISRLPVIPGLALDFFVGGAGKDADAPDTASPSATAGDGGRGGGGGGFQGLQVLSHGHSGGGGGGGATTVTASGFPIAVAGGGGGAGSVGAGGDAGPVGENAGGGAGEVGGTSLGGGGGLSWGGGGNSASGSLGGGGGGIARLESGGNAPFGVFPGGGAQVPFVWGGGGGGDGNGGTGGSGEDNGLGGTTFDPDPGPPYTGVGGAGNSAGGDGGQGGFYTAGGGGGGLGFSGGGAGALSGGGGGAGFGGGAGGGGKQIGDHMDDAANFGAGGGGGSSAVSDYIISNFVASSVLTRTGDGRVEISWDPVLDACGPSDNAVTILDVTDAGSTNVVEVPEGICAVTIVAEGADGGGSTPAGGKGAQVTLHLPVSPLAQLGGYVGGQGTDVDDLSTPGHGGVNGGGGGNPGGGGGGGGGATSVYVETTEDLLPIVTAGGGGGAGNGTGLTGGDAGLLGQDAGGNASVVSASRYGRGGSPAFVEPQWSAAGAGGSLAYGGTAEGDGGDGGDGIYARFGTPYGGGGGGAGASSTDGGSAPDLGNPGGPNGGDGTDGGGLGGSAASGNGGGGGGGGYGFGGGGGGANLGGGGGGGFAAGAGGDSAILGGGGGGGGTSQIMAFGTVGTSQLRTNSGDGRLLITYDPNYDACVPEPLVGAIPTETVITGDSPDPSATTMKYLVSGTVEVLVPVVMPTVTVTAAGDLPGSVVVSGDGSGCTDSSLTPTATPDVYGFACWVKAGAAQVAPKLLVATYTDSGTDYDSSTSDPEEHTVVDMPGPPTGVTVTQPGPGGRSTTVNATPPGGPLVPTGYQVRCFPDGVRFNTSPNADSRVVFTGGTTLPITVYGLTRGVTYRCMLRARYGPEYIREIGDAYEGPLSAASAKFTVPVVKPSAPTQVKATTPALPSGQSTTVSFVAGPNDTGAPRTFTTRCTSANGGVTRTATGNSPVGITGLTKGATYTCAVQATNSAGSSAWANAPAIIVPPAAPTGVSASAPVNHTTKVGFTPGPGGPAVTTFRATCTSTNGGATKTGTSLTSPITVTGLTAGKTYRCTVNPMYGTTPGATSTPSNTITG